MTPNQLLTCQKTGRTGIFIREEAKGYLCRAPNSSGARFYIQRPHRGDGKSRAEDTHTPWGAILGGAMNPELLALAQRIKARELSP